MDPQITQTPSSLTDPKPMGFPPRTCCVQGPDVRMAPGMLGGWGTRPGRSWGGWGCREGPSASRGPGGHHGLPPSPSLLLYPSGSRENAGHPPGLLLSRRGAQRGLATDSWALSPPSRASGGGVPRHGHSSCLGDALAWPTCSVRCGGSMGSGRCGGYFVRDPPHTPVSVCVSLTTQICVGSSRGDGSHPASQLFPLFLLLSLGLRVTCFGFDAIVFTRLPSQDFVNWRGSFKKSSRF